MSNNKIILNGCISKFKSENELVLDEGSTFELFSLTQIMKSFDLAFEEIQESIVDGGMDGGIDSIFVFVDDFSPSSLEDVVDIKFTRKSQVSIVVSQCKRENSFKESVIDKLITTLPELFDLEKSEDALLVRFNPDLVEKSIVAREVWKACLMEGGQLKIEFNYCCYAEKIEINAVFKSKVEQLKKVAGDLFVGAKISYENFSSEELLRRYQTHPIQRLSIKYKENPLTTSYLEEGIGYVGTVKLADYKTFLSAPDGSIREDLFESNIRHFQGLVDVNKKIKDSISNNKLEDFWWLNNGITIIASNPSLVSTTLSIDNVQIVNGLQTSYSVYLNHDGDYTDGRSVLVKVIINENKSTIDHIIASTNSQNPVSPALLRATDDVQREIELYYLNSGYFYDRRKNFYKNQGKPVSRIFSIQVTAQAIESILFSNPHSARSKPTSLIKEDTTYNKIFNTQYNYQAFLNCCLIWKKTVEFWSELPDKDTKSKLSNFKLHLARIAASFIINRAVVNANDLASLDINNFSAEIFNSTTALMLNSITIFLSSNPNANLINMAKTRGLTEVISGKLGEILPN